MIRYIVQILGLLLLLLGATLVTLKLKHRNDDGPSVLFPGGKLISGALHEGAEPDWSFTDDVFTIELETANPVSSRRIFVMEHNNRLYVPSGYMHTFLGKLWKDWAFGVSDGNDSAVARIEGVRYERTLVREMNPEVIEGVATKLAQKYAGGVTPETVKAISQSVLDGETWLFQMAPREAG
ncbi:MAG: hypothetical protein AAF513_20780 [Pseudomonadota bacterium]